jgi:Spy/CpxP family protein refolding chaperone
MSLFKTNYGYKLKILLTPRQAKKISKTAKERIEKLI